MTEKRVLSATCLARKAYSYFNIAIASFLALHFSVKVLCFSAEIFILVTSSSKGTSLATASSCRAFLVWPPSDRLLATAWTVTLGDYADRPNSYSISDDGGLSWSAPRSTGIRGQTLTPIPLGDDRLLVLYNRRHGEQAIMMCLVTVSEDGWQVHSEQTLYDAGMHYQRADDVESGIDELDAFAFGFPTAVELQDGAFLATHWCVEHGVCGIRWTRLRVHW